MTQKTAPAPGKEEALAYIESKSWRHSRLGLERITDLLHRLGNPQNTTPFVHVAGTNGKGSTCAFMAAILQEAGYKTGLFTSPYIRHFNERMQINGTEVTDDELVALAGAVRPHADAMEDHPTEFEIVTAMGFLWFARQKCDVVVLEVGLGGRLDATNAIGPPALAVITALALDHREQLGDTLEAIAAEKGGIIKPGGPVLLYPAAPGPRHVIEGICRQQQAPLHIASFEGLTVTHHDLEGQRFGLPPYQDLSIALLGSYQPRNAALALRGIESLRTRGWQVSDEALRRGLSAARWPARFQLACKNPPFIVDGGHNPQGAAALLESLEETFPGRGIIFLTGVMADKDHAAMYGPLRAVAKQVFCVTPENPRALPAEELAAFLKAQGFPHVTACPNVQAGVQAALAAAGPQDIVCAFGSFFMAGQVLASLEAL